MKFNLDSMKKFAAMLALLPMFIFSVACEPLPDDSDVQPDEEIAEELQIPLGTVKTQIHRARTRICEYIIEGGVL